MKLVILFILFLPTISFASQMPFAIVDDKLPFGGAYTLNGNNQKFIKLKNQVYQRHTSKNGEEINGVQGISVPEKDILILKGDNFVENKKAKDRLITVYVRDGHIRDLSPEEEIKRLNKILKAKCKPKPAPEKPKYLSSRTALEPWAHESCKELTKNSPKTEELLICSDALKKKIINASKVDRKLDRITTYRNMYTLLNPKERDFLAHTLTAHGEAGVLTAYNLKPSDAIPNENLGDMIIVMQVLKNRSDKAGGHASITDVALESRQFSMYDKGAHHWKTVLYADSSDRFATASVLAYQIFLKSKIKATNPSIDISKITGYHRDDSLGERYDLSKGKIKEHSIEINGNPLMGYSYKKKESKCTGPKKPCKHRFYSGIGYAFSPSKLNYIKKF